MILLCFFCFVRGTSSSKCRSTNTQKLPSLMATVHLAARESCTCRIVVGVWGCLLLPVFTIKTCQINVLLHKSIDTCWVAQKSQSIWPPTSPLLHIHTPTHSVFLCRLSFLFPLNFHALCFFTAARALPSHTLMGKYCRF